MNSPQGSGIYDIRSAVISGKQRYLRAFGIRLSIGNNAVGDDVWTGTAGVIPLPETVGEQMTIVSTDAQDGVGGTGAQSIEIHYLDATGNGKSETIIMNGVTSVNTVATNIRFVQEIHTMTAGSNNLAVGTITLYKYGSASTVYAQIQPQTNISLSSARMVPKGFKLFILGYVISGGAAAGGKSADVRLRATFHPGNGTTPMLAPGLFHFINNSLVFNTAIIKNFDVPREVPSLAIVKMTAYSTVGGADVQGSWEGILIPI